MQHDFPFAPRGGNTNLRVLFTGQVGVDKKPFLEAFAEYARRRGRDVQLFNVGDMMYADAPDVSPGRILDLPLARLESMRRSVFKEILTGIDNQRPVIVNTHAAFRWRHGLFPAFDHDLMTRLNADIYITLIDNVDAVHERLEREHAIAHSLKDVLVWREEEILATEVLASAIRGHGTFYIVARSERPDTMESLFKLLFAEGARRVYPSFPMTHVMDLPDIRREIDDFRARLAEAFVTFDPGDVDEKYLLQLAAAAMEKGETSFAHTVNGRQVQYAVADMLSVARDIDAQIYARDFKLIDQSHMIVSLIPQLPDGRPAISSGVERELQHAHEVTKDVFVIWKPQRTPSPFITATATAVYASLDEAWADFRKRGFIT